MKDELIITLSSLGGSRDIVVTWKAKLWVGIACTGVFCTMAVMGTTLLLTRASLAEAKAQLSALQEGSLAQRRRADELQQALDGKASDKKVSSEQPLDDSPPDEKNPDTLLLEYKPPDSKPVNPKDERPQGKRQTVKPVRPASAAVGVVAPGTVMASQNERKLLLGLIPNGTPFRNAARISSYFGLRRHPILGRIRGHKGIDFSASIGTPVYATAGGVISQAASNSRGGYGRQVLVQHGLGFSTRYAHLSQVSIKLGAHVAKGTLLGLTGNSGRSTGPHLHYEVLYRGKALDPINFARWSTTNFESIFSQEKEVPWASLIKQSHQWSQLASLPFLPKVAR